MYYRPGIVLKSLHALSHLFLTATLLDIILQGNQELETFTQDHKLTNGEGKTSL